MQELHNDRGYKSTESAAEKLDTPGFFDWFLNNTELALGDASFFEIGAGSGNFYGFLKKSGVTDYTGCEIGENQIAQFQAQFGKQAPLQKGDALSILQAEKHKKFDCIVALDVLEHLKEDYLVDLFARAKAQLEKEGEFWIKVPCAESILSGYVRYGDMTHERLFTLVNFKVLSEMHNLELLAYSGRIVKIRKAKDIVKYMHDTFLYLLNRFLFAFEIGIRKECGVFGTDLLVILKKRDD